MARIWRRKKVGVNLRADMTSPENGETVEQKWRHQKIWVHLRTKRTSQENKGFTLDRADVNHKKTEKKE